MRKYLDLFKQTAREFGEDKVPRLGAALAYYTVFSLAPLLLIAIAIAGMAFGEEAARNQVQAQLRGVIGPEAGKAIQEMVENAAKPKTGALATIVGILTLLFGASGVFGQLKDALNTIWEVEPAKTSGAWGFVKNRFLSMAMVLGVGFLLLVSLVIDAVITAGANRIFGESTAVIAQTLQILISLCVVTGLFALIFRYLPDCRIEWRDVWFGAGFTSLLFVIGKFALGLYLGRSAVGSTYGAAGSLVVLLLWVYYSAQILFFGAEFTQVYARKHGSRSASCAPTAAKEEEAHAPKAAPRPAATPAPLPLPAQRTPVRRRSPWATGAVGLAGLLFGAVLGGLTTTVVVVKSVKKLITAPFRT